jgi:endoglucanase
MKNSLQKLVWLIIALALGNQALIAQKAPFNRGINLSGWLQAGSASQIQFTRYTKTDFEQIKSLGCDVIRLPINLHFMTQGASDHNIEPLFFNFLDQVINWAEELQLHLILDNHTFDPNADTDPNVGTILEKVWKQMASRYKTRSNLIYYEVLNEPHGISNQLWNNIQQGVINAIRSIDTKHTIIVGATNFNSYNDLKNLPVYSDNNLIYTFHFYDPFLFTHQGANWVSPSMEPLKNMPFPYQADKMPGLPNSLQSTWIGNAYNNYQNDGTIAKVKELIDIAVQFQTQRQVPIFCGEFGVLMNNSQEPERVFWYETVRKYLEEKQIAWTTWDYHGGFGLFERGGNDLFAHDLNVPLLQALDFNVPEQTDYVLLPDNQGFVVYDDYVGKGIFGESYGSQKADYYAPHQPNNDKYCLYWTQAKQYETIGFDFKPNKDLSQLVAQNYVIDLFVRGNSPEIEFNLRFMDTKTSDNDRPWRMIAPINQSKVPMDKRWHHLRIPLKNFTEEGAWDNNTWYNPEGKFDWQAIDRFEIVAEYGEMGSKNVWFDNLIITNVDTAKVLETDIFEFDTPLALEKWQDRFFKVYPNPSVDKLTIENILGTPFTFELMTLEGRKIIQHDFSSKTTFDISGLPSGVYILRISNKDKIFKISKVVKR